MKEVPDTGSIPVSPITLTAIAPRRKVVNRSTIENITEGSTGNPPITNIMIMAKNAIIMKIGICDSGHSYQPLPSMNSSPLSPENAVLISPNIDTKVGAIFKSPSTPPPSIAPIAIIRTTVANAFH